MSSYNSFDENRDKQYDVTGEDVKKTTSKGA